MRAMIFAAGLGTRLAPLTLTRPKALVEVAGQPMLQRVILRLKAAGFDEIIVNVHHFGQQIIDFLQANNSFGVRILVSDEREELLDTGGGIRKAGTLIHDGQPLLIHNVDILSNVDLKKLYVLHDKSGRDATLLVSERQTSRYLLFDKDLRLHGWINKKTGEVKPEGFLYDKTLYNSFAFAGIHVISPSLLKYMTSPWTGKFPVIDFYLDVCKKASVYAYVKPDLQLIDIGKPETLVEADKLLRQPYSPFL